MNKSCGIGCCGKACCICVDNSHCDGCKQLNPYDKSWCDIFRCCSNKGLSSCGNCVDFPCDKSMDTKLVHRSFLDFINLFSEEELLDHLNRNEKNGMIYEYLASTTGDYDQSKTKQEIFELLIQGFINER